MRQNSLNLIIALSVISIFTGVVQATIPITGNVYGPEAGLLHMNLNTSVNTFPACVAPDDDPSRNPNCYDPNGAYGEKFICPTTQYYTDIESDDYVGDPSDSFVAQIGELGTSNCNETLENCYLSGFMWSDRIGWTALDGPTIEGELGTDFPEGHFGRMDYSNAVDNGIAYANGFIWNEAGWIQLSACAGLDSLECGGVSMCSFDVVNNTCQIDPNNFPLNQSATEWGVFLDLNQTPGARGRQFEGYALHEKLGWIKFGSEVGDACTFGAWTTWEVDLDPPELPLETLNPGEDHFWWKNTSASGNFIWPQFATDTDSGIDFASSNLTLTKNAASNFDTCNDASVTLINNGGYADLSIPSIADLNNNPFCMYTLTGTIFDDQGNAFYIDEASSLPPDLEPNEYRDPITFYIMAGDYDPDQSTISDLSPGTQYADGVDEITVGIQPRDIGGNPILNVRTDREVVIFAGAVLPEPDDSLWRRDVRMNLNFFESGQNTPYYFDAILPSQTPGNMPVRVDQFNPSAGTTYSANTQVSFPAVGTDRLGAVAGTYPIAAVGYSPTSNCGDSCLNEFALHTVNLRVIDQAIDSFGLQAALPAYDNSETMNQNLPFEFNFDPPFNTTSASLSTETVSIGQAMEFAFTLENFGDVDLEEIIIDNNFDLINEGGVGFGEEVLSIYDINLSGSGETETGRTDPFSGTTRYALAVDNAVIDESENSFHSDETNYHSPSFDFYSNYDSDPSYLDSNGIYLVDGPVYGQEEGEDVSLDRTDLLTSSDPYLAINDPVDHIIEMLPIQNVGATFENDVSFSVNQLLGYRLPDSIRPFGFTEFAVFEAENALEGIDVENTGLGASPGSTISGSNIFRTISGQDGIITLESDAAKDLQRIMRQNTAGLTRNITPCSITTLNSLSTTASSCIVVNENENTVVAVYEANDPGDLLTLGGAGDILIPDGYRYTLVLKGGADLFISDNLDYPLNPLENTSFGVILLQDDTTNTGGNVLISPEITNIAGLFYAEGSFLSSDGNDFYYGNGLDSSDLDNQLFCNQCAIASKNTLGGGPNNKLPEGVSCSDGSDLTECANRYDLNLLRRHPGPNASGYTPPSVLFSGGGYCDNSPSCYDGPLSSTIVISGGQIDLDTSISTDAFYIEQSNRPAPPGFTTGGGFSVDPNVIR